MRNILQEVVDGYNSMLAAPGVAENCQAMKLLGAGGGGYAFFVSESAKAAGRVGDVGCRSHARRHVRGPESLTSVSTAWGCR